ncbi:MAG: hypothetical protein ABIP97_04875, partial [Chthoniobacterales bacterium]
RRRIILRCIPPMKKLLPLLSVILLLSVATGSAEPQPYIKPSKSKPVVVNGVEFVAATTAQWILCWKDPNKVQLFITNRTDKPILIPTFDRFGIILKSADGKKLPITGGRDITFPTWPIRLDPGETYCLCGTSILRWQDDEPKTKIREFSYTDITNMFSICKPLVTGRYSLSFSYNNSKEKAAEESKKVKDIAIWTGEAVTNEATFDLIDPTP